MPSSPILQSPRKRGKLAREKDNTVIKPPIIKVSNASDDQLVASLKRDMLEHMRKVFDDKDATIRDAIQVAKQGGPCEITFTPIKFTLKL